MLGSAADAEDIVQDAWLRWQTTDRRDVHDASAFLVTVATRLSLNVVQSARVRRETYVGPWLPEPVDTSADPTLGAERGEALEFAVLLLLEALPPKERAAFILREAFDYAYRDIADVLQVSEDNARQLVTRARKHVANGRRAPVSTADRRRLLEAFIGAARSGDVGALEDLFAADVVSSSDGGGMVRAARRPVVGRDRVAKFIASFSSHFWAGVTVEPIEANGQPSVLFTRDGKAIAVATIDASSEGIDQIMWMMRPSKLGAVASFLESRRNNGSGIEPAPDDTL